MPLWTSPRKTGVAGLCSEEAARSCDAGELRPLGLSEVFCSQHDTGGCHPQLTLHPFWCMCIQLTGDISADRAWGESNKNPAGDLNENFVENEDKVLTLSITSRAFLLANFGPGGLVQ